MAYPIPNVRPAVISVHLRLRLGDYLRFRQLFRDIYGSELRWDLLLPLVRDLPDIRRELSAEAGSFVTYLEKLAT